MGSMTMTIVFGVVIVVVIVFVIVSTITGKKAQKKEQQKRKKVVRNEIKRYLAQVENKKNISVEFEKVAARRGAEYKYRDVFDVVVNILEPKTGAIVSTKAYEIEGLTTKIDKKNYNTDWTVNGEIDLDETRKRIAIAEKAVKLSKSEKAQIKSDDRAKTKEIKQTQKEDYKKMKSAKKDPVALEQQRKELLEKQKLLKKTAVKFIPRR